MIVFFLSVVLAGTFPSLFKPVVADLGRVLGIGLILVGLTFSQEAKLPIFPRWGIVDKCHPSTHLSGVELLKVETGEF